METAYPQNLIAAALGRVRDHFPEGCDREFCCKMTKLALAVIAVFVGSYLFLYKPLILIAGLAAGGIVHQVVSRCFGSIADTPRADTPRQKPTAPATIQASGTIATEKGLNAMLQRKKGQAIEALPKSGLVLDFGNYQSIKAVKAAAITLAEDGDKRRCILIPIGEETVLILRDMTKLNGAWQIYSTKFRKDLLNFHGCPLMHTNIERIEAALL